MCPSLIPPGNGSLNQHLQYRNITEARCNTGYRFPDNAQTIYLGCMEQGEWNVTLEDGKIPDCQGHYVKKKQNKTKQKNIQSHCHNTHGYVMFFWNITHVSALCFLAVVCAEPPVIENASLLATYDRHYKGVAHYECHGNLTMEDGFPTKDITCMADGTWSEEVFSCAGEWIEYIYLLTWLTLTWLCLYCIVWFSNYPLSFTFFSNYLNIVNIR